MPRTSSKSHLKPDFEAEIRQALGKEPDDIEGELGSLLKSGKNVSAGLLRAIGAALLREDSAFELTITRTSSGRPRGHAERLPRPQEVARFVADQIEAGELRKNAIVDAQTQFRVGRSTIYRLLNEAEEIESRQNLAISLMTVVRRAPGGRKIERSKRSKRRRIRKKLGKTARTLQPMKLNARERERARLLARRSKNPDNIWD